MVTEKYGAPRSYGPHKAIDISNPLGGKAYAILDGKVIKKGSAGGGKYGPYNYIKIRHANGYESSYVHTRLIKTLEVGASVSRGQTIGFSDGSGTKHPHTHLVIRKNGEEISPCSVVTCSEFK